MKLYVFIIFTTLSLQTHERKDILDVFPQPIWQEILDYLSADEPFVSYCMYLKNVEGNAKIPLSKQLTQKMATKFISELQYKLQIALDLKQDNRSTNSYIQHLLIQLNHMGTYLPQDSNQKLNDACWEIIWKHHVDFKKNHFLSQQESNSHLRILLLMNTDTHLCEDLFLTKPMQLGSTLVRSFITLDSESNVNKTVVSDHHFHEILTTLLPEITHNSCNQ